MNETKKNKKLNEDERKNLLFVISPQWQNYLSSLFLIIVFPLAPIFIVDYIIINGMADINVQSLSITASIYFITIGFSSNNKITLILGILGCFTFAVIYGKIESNKMSPNYNILSIEESKNDNSTKQLSEFEVPIENKQIKVVGILCILFISVVHSIERYNRHVVLKESFFEIS